MKFFSLMIIVSCFYLQGFAKSTSVKWLEKPQQSESTDMIDIMSSGSLKRLSPSNHIDPEIAPPSFSDHDQNSANTSSEPSLTQNKAELYSLISHQQIKKSYPFKIPTMAWQEPVTRNCHPYFFLKKLEQIQDPSNYIQNLRNYFNKCGKKLTNKLKYGLTDLTKLALRKYEVFDNPLVHSLELQLKNGDSVEGYLALKDNQVRRPLVILKCGIFCSGRSSAINNMILMALYDSGPFHVMMLANHTGPKNIEKNKRLNFGGFLEGQEVIEVAKWVRNEAKFKSLVSEVHVLGISLGGHAALYAGIYNEYLNEKAIDSVVGFCPVVNIENSLNDLLSGSTKNLAALGIHYLVSDNYAQVPTLRPHFKKGIKGLDIKNMARNLARANTDYINTLDSNYFLAPYRGINISNHRDFYDLGNFPLQAQQVSTPTLVWGSKNDFVVENNSNSGFLEQTIPLPTPSKNISVLNVKKGSHCAIAESYGWNTVAKVLNGFFVRNSPSLKHQKLTKVSPINIAQPKVKFNEQHMGQEFLAFANKNVLVLKYKIYTGSRYKDPFYSLDKEFRYDYRQIRFDQLPIQLQTPKNSVEAQRLTRWLNSNVTLKSNGDIAFRNQVNINQMEWTTY